MSTREEIVSGFYGAYSEEDRLTRSRHGQLEYATTMEYIGKYLKEGNRVLEVGAGTGRYTLALAQKGYDVTAVELVESNLEILQHGITDEMTVCAYQGDACDLSRFEEDTFDVTLVLGPLYHLYEAGDVQKCIDEAVRVTKKKGVIFFAFISVHAIMLANYFRNNFSDGLTENFDEDYNALHFKEQLFTGYDIDGIENLFKGKNLEKLHFVSVDGVMEVLEQMSGFGIDDDDFDKYKKYHLSICEKREMLGYANHLLYICTKQ